MNLQASPTFLYHADIRSSYINDLANAENEVRRLKNEIAKQESILQALRDLADEYTE